MVPVLILATALLVGGVAISFSRKGVEKVTRKKIVVNHSEKDRISKSIEKLKSEKLSFAIRRDHAKKQIAEAKQRIEILNRLMKQSYL